MSERVVNPLQRLRSIKVKLSILIVAAVVVTLGVNEVGLQLNFAPLFRAGVAAAIALAMVQMLSRGMTSPLREMERAATAMAAGDHDQRVARRSSDEVGRLAVAFNHMAAELAGVDRQRRDLVANVSHELRTPISALRATLENLVDGVVPAEPALLQTMLDQIERLQRLVAQLLDLSRLESGGSELRPRPFEAVDLLERVADEARLQGTDVRLAVSVVPPDLVVDGDPERLHQVLANLVENAVRFSPPGAEVAVSARADGDQVRLEVVDAGPGIAESDATRVFERFYRADQARSSVEGGAGLGLSIARWIVDLHGGRIRAERAVPEGCRMVVELPVVPPARRPPPTGPVVAPVAAAGANRTLARHPGAGRTEEDP